MKLENYPKIIEYLKKQTNRNIHLLLGNGFSMAYDSTIFSYNSLNAYVKQKGDEILRNLLSVTDNTNFELLMKQLEAFIRFAEVFGCEDELLRKINETKELLKKSLIEAIKDLHPEYVFKIPDQKSKICANFIYEFINNGGNIFTTNYDLLLYWVLMRNKSDKISIDGFGRDAENLGAEYIPPEEIEYSELRWGKHKEEQNTFYLHGALPLFDTGVEIMKEEYDGFNYLLENIRHRIERKEYPIFVTGGSARDKLDHIMHNKYLSFCYSKLTEITGSLVTFGFNFGEYDQHIIDAINIAAKQGRRTGDKLLSIYIGVYSEGDKKHIESYNEPSD
jgi:hypothetical protein